MPCFIPDPLNEASKTVGSEVGALPVGLSLVGEVGSVTDTVFPAAAAAIRAL